MENETTNVEEHFAKEVGKAFVLSTAASAGVFAGIAIVGIAAGWLHSRRSARNPEKAQEEN